MGEGGEGEPVGGAVGVMGECEADVVVADGVVGAGGEVAVVLCAWSLEGLSRRGGSIEWRPWVEFVTPCAVP